MTHITNDPSMTLYAWQLMLAELVARHGLNAILSADAGANNVTLVIAKEPE